MFSLDKFLQVYEIEKYELPLQIAIVTSPFHQLRAGLTFMKALEHRKLDKDIKITVVRSDSPLANSLYTHIDDTRNTLREICALVYYKMMNWI